jgi:hypothetical protein
MFYQQLEAPVLIGVEATGNSQWFVELVEDLGHAIWIGDAAQIRASYVRKKKTDKRDAAHILKLLLEGRFPRLWTPDREQRDLRQLVLHRHKLVEIRSRVKNELQHLSLNKGMQRKGKLWSQAGQKLLRELPLKPWADGRSWERSRSRATACCDRCWWKRHRLRCVSIRDIANSIYIAVTKSRKVWPRWRRRASWPYDSTGCCGPRRRIRRSFVSRAARRCPWSAQARPQN